jgi:hypothetical protein
MRPRPHPDPTRHRGPVGRSALLHLKIPHSKREVLGSDVDDELSCGLVSRRSAVDEHVWDVPAISGVLVAGIDVVQLLALADHSLEVQSPETVQLEEMRDVVVDVGRAEIEPAICLRMTVRS